MSISTVVSVSSTLVGTSEIAQRLGVTRQRITQLSKTKGFPEPLERLTMGPVWAWEDVEAWAKETGRL